MTHKGTLTTPLFAEVLDDLYEAGQISEQSGYFNSVHEPTDETTGTEVDSTAPEVADETPDEVAEDSDQTP